MDNNSDQNLEQNNQNINQRRNTGVVDRLNQFSSGFKSGLGLGGEKGTKDRLKNRGQNEPRGVNKESGKLDQKEGSDKKGGLEKKNGLKKKDEKSQGKGLGDLKSKLSSKLGSGAGAASAALKAKSLKLKLLKLKIIGIALGVFLGIFMIAYLVLVIDNFFSSIVLNFGVPEQRTDEDDLEGLYTDSKYIRNPDTGEMYTWPELIQVLNNDESCKAGFFQGIWESLFPEGSDEFKDVCQLMRYIKKKTNDYETKYMHKETNGPNKLDRGLIIGTLFFGYDSQATYDNYETPPAKEDEKGDTFISAADHFEALKNVIKDGKLTKPDVNRIIQNTIFEDVYPSFTWEIREEWSISQQKYIKVGYCNTSVVQNYEYSRDKWEMFIRWNDEKDLQDGDDNIPTVRNKVFSVPGYLRVKGSKLLDKYRKISNSAILTLVGTGYTYDTSMNNAWKSTSEECNSTISKDALLSLVDKLDGSVTSAHDYFIKREYNQIVDTTIYFQKVEEIYSTTKDNFTSRNIKFTTTGPTVHNEYVEFEYKHGFGYINFPSFKQADEDSNLPGIEYNDATTPKKLEEIIEETKDRKYEINNVLLLKDLDSAQYGENGYWDENGNYIEGTIPDFSNPEVVTNAYCKSFLSSDLDDITVKLTDCDGNQQDSVSFKDYIIGVTVGEIGPSSYNNKNYALTQMIASISYAMARRGNYKKGSTITMRNGDCDQVFSSPSKGSYRKEANLMCSSKHCRSYYQGSAPSAEYEDYKSAISDAAYQKFGELYEIAKQYLIISNNNIKEAGYVNTTQEGWEAAANNGENFAEIIKKTYGDSDLIECSTYEDNFDQNIYDEVYAGQGCLGIVKAATAEIGNKEEPKNSDYIKYNDWYYGEHKKAQWCAIFVTYIASKTGYLGTEIPKTAGVKPMQQYFVQKGSWRAARRGYDPKPGDIVIFQYDAPGEYGHVAIVVDYNKSTGQVTTIGGNEGHDDPEGGRVKRQTYASKDSASIAGYGKINCKEDANTSGILKRKNYNEQIK